MQEYRVTKRFTLGLALSLVLAACGASNPAQTGGTAPAGSGPAQALAASSECRALYAVRPERVRVDPSLRYGSPGTLILSFVDDTSKGRAINWMDSNLAVDPGQGLGALSNLPVAALTTLITPELVAQLEANLGGLLSIYQDAPLRFLLDESVQFIGADAARSDYGVSGQGVGVAVIDSGIDASHPDLLLGGTVGRNVKIVASVTQAGADATVYADLANTDTTSGHGTHVASIIAGSGAASQGSASVRRGVAPGATLVGIGTGEAISILYALQGFDFALDPQVRAAHNIRVISNSWGTSGDFDPYGPISLASKRAYDAGIIVTFAAGNEGPGADTLNPYSASPCVLSVAAGDKGGALASFSSRGIPGDTLVHPDITAPGVQISAARAATGTLVTTLPDADNVHYATLSGTSMATPHVSGVIALMLEANADLTLDGVLSIFQKTARPMYDAGLARQLEPWEAGFGYLDAHAAVRRARP